MFEFVRNNKRWMQVLLALLIAPSMVFLGVEGYRNNAGGDDVATVAGKGISQAEWDDAQRKQMDRYREMMGERFNPKMFESAEVKQGVLDGLIAERAIDAEVRRAHLASNPAALHALLNEQFKAEDGKIDKTKYETFLATQGMDARTFEARLARDMTINQLAAAVQGSALVPRALSARLSELTEQEREVQELMFPATDFAAQVKVTDEMVKAFYDKNEKLFQIPEQAKIEYVVLSPAAVESQIQVTDQEIAEFYEKNKQRYGAPEQRVASHILISVPEGASAADKAKAKAKAEAVLAQLRAAPGTFAEVAKKESQDPGSAAAGGDLGQVEKGAFVKSVEDSIYALKQGEISNLVESQFGYHIITVTKLVPPAIKPLAEVKEQIAAEIKRPKVEKRIAELTETFNDTVYEQSDSLKPVADKLKLEILTADNVTRTVNPQLGQAPFNNEKFLTALFSTDVVRNKRNTDAVEVSPRTLVAGRIVEHRPASKRPLAEVQEPIRQRVMQEEAVKLAVKAGEAKLAAVKASGDVAGFSAPKVVSRMQQPVIPVPAARQVMRADPSKLPAYVGVELPGQGYAVYRINKVSQPAQPDLAAREQVRQQLVGMVGNQEMYQYVEALKAKAKAKKNEVAKAATDGSAAK